jgi:hypothetical protein
MPSPEVAQAPHPGGVNLSEVAPQAGGVNLNAVAPQAGGVQLKPKGLPLGGKRIQGLLRFPVPFRHSWLHPTPCLI